MEDALANYDNPALFRELANIIEALPEPDRTRHRTNFDDNRVHLTFSTEQALDGTTIVVIGAATYDDTSTTIFARLQADRFGLTGADGDTIDPEDPS